MTVLLLSGGIASAQGVELVYSVGFDLDHDAATGCSLTVRDAGFTGDVPGIELRLDLRVDPTAVPPTVLSSEVALCADPATGTFGPPTTVDATGWPVGLGVGVGGSDVVEGMLPRSYVPAGTTAMRLVFTSRTPVGDEDVAGPAVLAVAAATAIPTLDTWGLIALGVLLAAAGVLVLRRGSGAVAMVIGLGLLLSGGVAVAQAAFAVDGDVSDWFGRSPLVSDGVGDSVLGDDDADIVAGWAAVANLDVFVRLDVSDVGGPPPVAEDDSFATDEDSPISGDVLADNGNGADTDPLGGSLTVIELDGAAFTPGTPVTLPSGASLTMRSDGTFDWDPAGAFDDLAAGSSDVETFTYTIENDVGGSAAATVTIDVSGVNDAPTLSPQTFAVSFAEGGPPVAIAPTVAVSDDDTNLQSATVTITNLTDTGDELLAAATGGTAITASFVAPTLTLSGADTVANYEGVLRSVTYENTAADPTDTPARSISITVDDGTVASTPATSTVTLTVFNNPPVVTPGAPGAFTEGGGPVAVAPALTVTDADDPNLSGATVTLTNLPDVGDEVLAAATGGTSIGATWAPPTLTLSGVDTLANYQTVLRSVTYDNASEAPDPADRVVAFAVTDESGASSVTETVNLTVTGVNDPPTLSPASFAVSFAEGEPPVLLAPTITVADADDTTLASATVTITNLTDAGDELLAAVTGGTSITAGYVAPTLTLSGADTLANYQAVLRSVTYENTSTNPTETPNRSITFTVDDGTDVSAAATATVNLSGVNSPPVVVAGAGAAFTEGGGAVVVASALTVTDADSANLGGATVTITNLLDAGSEALAAATGGTSITASYAAPTLTLSGADTVANYQAVLRSVTYDNTSAAPTTTTRSVSFVVQDDLLAPSAPDATSVTVTAVNSPPTVGPSPVETFDGVGNTALQLAATKTVSPAVFVAGNLLANFVADPDGPLPLAASLDGATAGAVVTVNGDGTFTYLPPVGVSGASDTFTYDVTDGIDTVTRTVTVNLTDRVWYVDNTATAGGNGRSSEPFDTLVEAQTASAAGDTVFVFSGDGTTTGQNAGITLKNGQKLYGEAFGLEVDAALNGNPAPAVLHPAGDRPHIGHAAGDGVTVLADAATLGGIEIRGLEISATDNAVDAAATGAFDLDLAVTDTVLSSTGGTTLAISGTGTTGTVVVTELATHQVTGATSGGGIVLTGVTFDADLVTAGLQPVSAGDVTVGNPASPGDVTGPGVRLDGVRGTLVFGTLDVGNTGGPGLYVRDADGKAGTFALTTSGGTVATVNGPAVDVDPVTLAVVLDAVSSTVTSGVTPYGINLHTVAGSFQVSGATSISASGAGSVGAGIVATDATATITFTGPTTVSTTTGAGIALTNVDGPFTVASTAGIVTGAGGAAIDIDQGLGDVIYNGSIDNAAGRSVEITNHEGPGGGSTVSITGPITDSGAGIFLDNNDQGAGGTTVNLLSTLSLTTGASTAFTATNGGAVNVTDPANVNTIVTTTGSGLVIADTQVGAAGVKFTTVNVGDANPAAPNAANGVLLTNVGANAVTISGGAIQNVTTRGVDVAGGSGSVTVGASISTTTTGRSIEVTGHGGGTVAFSGAVDDNGPGIFLDANSGATMTFTGSLDVDTVGANIGFNATGGGTVTVLTGTNDISTAAGTGTAVNIVNTTIGAAGVTFRSVSATGAVKGIVLNTTGGLGGLTVTGTGTTDGSGGAIANVTQRGVEAIATSNLSLANMAFTNTPTADAGGAGVCDGATNAGCYAAVHLATVTGANLVNLDVNGAAEQCVNGVTVSGLTLADSTITNCGNEVFEGGLRLSGLSGTSAITGTDISLSAERNAWIVNSTGALTLVVTDSTFRDTQSSGFGADGLEIVLQGGATANLDVTNSSFLRNRTNGLQVLAEDTAAVSSLDITGSTFDSGAGDGIGLDLSTNDAATLNYNLIGNPVIRSRSGTAVNSQAFATSSIQARIQNNPDIRVQSGSGIGIDFKVDDTARGRVLIDNNTVSAIEFDAGIRAFARLRPGAACGTGCTDGRLDATITNNSVTVLATALYDIWVQASDSNTTCANVANNAASGVAIAAFRERSAAAASTVLLEGFTTDATTTWNSNGNTPVGSVSASNTGTLTGGTCTLPSHPTP